MLLLLVESLRRRVGGVATCLAPFLFLLYTSLSCMSYAFNSVIVRQTSYLNPAQLSLITNFGIGSGAVPLVAFYFGRHNVKGKWGITITTSLVTAGGMCLLYFAYRYISLGETAVVTCTTPLGVALVARFLLGETLGVVQGGAVLVAVSGVMVSARVPELFTHGHFEWEYFAGMGSALVSTVCTSFGIVLLRKLKEVHFSLQVLTIALACIFVGLLSLFFVGPPPSLGHCGQDTFLFIMLGLLGFLGDCFFVLATETGKAALVSLVKCSMDVVFAMLLQLIFFGELPDMYNLCGAIMVLLAIVVITLREWVSSLPENSSPRRALKFLLA